MINSEYKLSTQINRSKLFKILYSQKNINVVMKNV